MHNFIAVVVFCIQIALFSAIAKKESTSRFLGIRLWNNITSQKCTKCHPCTSTGAYKYVTLVGNKRYYCRASDVKDCPLISGGKWELRNRYDPDPMMTTKYDDEKMPKRAHWMLITNKARYYCTAENVKLCPDMQPLVWMKITRTMEFPKPPESPKNDGTPEEDGDFEPKKIWRTVVRHVVTTCHAKQTSGCRKVIKGSRGWLPFDYSYDDAKVAKWYHVDEENKFYCIAPRANKCPKLRGHKWKQNPRYDGSHETPDEIEDSDPRIFLTMTDGTAVTCYAKNESDCENNMMSHFDWLPLKNSFGDEEVAQWFIVEGDHKLYCIAQHSKKCPKVRGHKWKRNPQFDGSHETPDEYSKPKTFLTVIDDREAVTCHAKERSDCQKVIKGVRGWLPFDYIYDDAKVAKWYHVDEGRTLYCVAPRSYKCPKFRGHNWKRNPQYEGFHETPDDLEDSDPRIFLTMTDDHERLICQAMKESDCQKNIMSHFEWVPLKNSIQHEKVAKWFIVEDDVNRLLYCLAPHSKQCPKVRGHEWKRNPQHKGSLEDGTQKVEVWVLSHDRNLKCLAIDVKDCPKPRIGKWKPEKRDDPDDVERNAKWITITVDSKVFCDAVIVRRCSRKLRGQKWYTNNEYHINHYPGKKAEEVKMWVVSLDDSLRCLAANVNDCPETSKGKWVPEKQGLEDPDKEVQNAKFIIVVDDFKILCAADNVKKCPKLKVQGSIPKWKKNPLYDPALKTPDEDSVLGKIKYGDVEIPCTVDNLKKCIQLHEQNKWQKHEKYHTTVWKTTVDHVKIMCHAKKDIECQKVMKGKWRPSDKNQYDTEESKWFFDNRKKKFYCFAHQSSKCPKVPGHKWKENPNYSGGQSEDYVVSDRSKHMRQWAINVNEATVTCHAHNVKECPKPKNVKGKWKPKKGSRQNLLYSEWVTTVSKTKVTCEAATLKECPEFHRHKGNWRQIVWYSEVVH